MLPTAPEAGDGPPPRARPSSSRDPDLHSLFAWDRLPSSVSLVLFLVYVPIGLCLVLFRCFLGFHAFLVACILRKANLLRGVVLRVLCALCGIVVTSENAPDSSSRVLVANHVSVLDHLAVDLVHPCVLPSIWDIPSALSWCLGYADLGAREGRAALIEKARNFVETQPLALLSFPESALTNGRTGLLAFSSWPFNVASSVQPVAIRLSRPFLALEASVMGSTWWQDILVFLFLPVTFINIRFLRPVSQHEKEEPDAFASRVQKVIADDLGLATTSYTSHDAVDAVKTHIKNIHLQAAAGKPRRKLEPRKLDEAAMRIKQSFPAAPLIDIRRDLDTTSDPRLTIERIKAGVLPLQGDSKMTTNGSNPTEWRKLFNNRKWTLIESNRARYLQRMKDES